MGDIHDAHDEEGVPAKVSCAAGAGAAGAAVVGAVSSLVTDVVETRDRILLKKDGIVLSGVAAALHVDGEMGDFSTSLDANLYPGEEGIGVVNGVSFPFSKASSFCCCCRLDLLLAHSPDGNEGRTKIR